MILLSAQSLSRQFDAAPVFSDVSFDIRLGERIGLVGPNGTGKTTLMKILAGLDQADKGEIEQSKSTEISLLKQEADFDSSVSLLDTAKAGLAHLYELQQRAKACADEMAQETDADQLEKLHRRYDQIQEELSHHDAYQIDHRVDEVLFGLGFNKDQYSRPITEFSGGQQSRALLAQLLLRSPNLMLLDEPTNHLDIAATEWLESFLARSTQAMVVVSHDRFFLDRVCTRIWEMHRGTLTSYNGNFSAYWKQRAERVKVLERTQAKQQEFIEKTEDFIRKNKSGQKHAQAADREKKLSRVERVEVLDDFGSPTMGFAKADRTGDWVLDIKEMTQGYDKPLIEDLNLRVLRGSRLGIFGANGTGKTTLLKTLIGEMQPMSGKIRHGTHVRIGYFDQQLETVDPQVDAIEAVRPLENPEMSPGKVRSLLAKFGLRGDIVFQPVGSMSGGEKNKVALARLAAREPNVLVLDEPTNHLDLWSRDSLEKAVKEFNGTVLFVSHDRYFLDQVAEMVLVLEPDEWRFYEGNYSRYAEFMAGRDAIETSAGDESTASKTVQNKQVSNTNDDSKKEKKPKRKFPYRKVKDIEADIAENEELLEQLEASLADPETHRDGERMKETTQAFDETREKLEQLYEHWEEASELN